MGYLRTKRLIDGILKVGAGGLVVGTIVIAPNALVAVFGIIDPLLKDTTAANAEFKRLMKYMHKHQLIELMPYGDESKLVLTSKGEQRLQTAEIYEIVLRQPKKWDKQWRFVIFDIPRQKQNIRYEFLSQIKRMGLYKLQGSIWVYPFACEAEIAEISRCYGIEQCVSFIVGKIYTTQENKLLRHFSDLLSNKV